MPVVNINPIQTMKKTVLTHAEFGTVVLRLLSEKANIEARIAKGTTIVDLANHYRVSKSVFMNAAKSIGIELPVRGYTHNTSAAEIEALKDRITKLEETVEWHTTRLDGMNRGQ